MPWYLRPFKYKYVSTAYQPTWLGGQILSYRFLFFIFFLRSEQKQFAQETLVLLFRASVSYFSICEMGLMILIPIPTSRGFFGGEDRRVLNELHLPSTLPGSQHTLTEYVGPFIPGNRIPHEDRLLTIQREPRVKAEAYKKCEPRLQYVTGTRNVCPEERREYYLSKSRNAWHSCPVLTAHLYSHCPLCKETFLFPFYR